MKIRTFSFVVLFASSSFGIAIPNCAMADPVKGGYTEEEINGLLVDHTMTRIGREFFDNFSARWRLNGGNAYDNLTFYERPSARSGSVVWIEYRSQTLYSTNLRPNTVNVDAIADNAIQQVHGSLGRAKISALLNRDPDLAKDEI